MYTKLEWLTVHQLVAFHRIVIVYKIRRTGEPEYLFEKLSRENRRGNIIIPNTKLTLHQRSFVQDGATLWYLVPLDIRNINEERSFKIELRRWIQNHVAMFL